MISSVVSGLNLVPSLRWAVTFFSLLCIIAETDAAIHIRIIFTLRAFEEGSLK
jgi:hypothetical protein